MLPKNYIFESKNTRYHRFLGNLFFAFIFLLSIFFIGILYLPYSGRALTEESQTLLFESQPELIVVFTGDFGRIPAALDRLKTSPKARLLISGVDNRNNFKILLGKIREEAISGKDFFLAPERIIDLDYHAQNTFENVLLTLDYLNKNPHIREVLVISSDYHLKRISLFLETLTPPEFSTKFHLFGVESNLKDYRTWIIVGKELVKLFRGYFLTLAWDPH